ncbi:uncharacterized protein [Branchiostoma lanceolatum]|uniref:uncharacterized protein n=1 Tax=Branchiostoma lanceolatum TaxID=7740 RepID=UPI003456F167
MVVQHQNDVSKQPTLKTNHTVGRRGVSRRLFYDADSELDGSSDDERCPGRGRQRHGHNAGPVSVRPGHDGIWSGRDEGFWHQPAYRINSALFPGSSDAPVREHRGHDAGPVRERPGYDGGPVRVRPGHDGGPVRERPGYDGGPVRVRPGHDGGPVRVRPGHDGIWSDRCEGFWHQPAYRINSALFPGSQQTIQSRGQPARTEPCSERHDGKHPNMRCHGDAVGDKRLASRLSTLTSRPTPLEVLQKIRTSKMVTSAKASTVTGTETSKRQHSVWSSDSESESSDDESCWCLECFKCRIMGTDVPHEDKFAVTRPGGDHKKPQSSSEHGPCGVGSSACPQFFNNNDSSRHGDKRIDSSERKRCSSDSGSDRCKRIKLS